MATKATDETLKNDLEWLMAQPRTLERDHIEAILRYSAEREYDLRERAKKLERALVWALGAGDPFRKREEGEGAYWWRKELAERAGLRWNSESYVRDEETP